MPKSLEKTRKKIAKKKGNITALHENSRDSQRLRRAQNRDDKLLRVASARKKNDKPLVIRAKYFQETIRANEGKPLELDAIHIAISTWVHQNDEEFSNLKKDRRAGRPASTREDLLRIKIAADEKEYESGFYMPDLTDSDNVVFLDRWEGDWSYLSTLKWVRISRGGLIQPTKFPPKGESSFARSAPRTVSRLSAAAIRQSTSRSPAVQAAWRPTSTQALAAFSSSALRRSKAAEGDEELIVKLDSELQMEKEMKLQEGVPTSVKDYIENGPFEVIDTPGQEEVVLTRQFGNEKIQITFSIADINSMEPENDFEDPAMSDEQDGQSNENPEESAADGEGNEEGERSYPARLNIIIEKPGKGALNVESIVQDGMHVIESVYYYADSSFAYAKTPEKIHGRQDLYSGPPFGNLDEDLQVLMERYLDERGINTALAIFVPDYIDMKEQKEYMKWLESVKSFVEA
ncbi:hypothetical protein HYFRA_00009958 [Hymenoscyphus fraxineus]|uniref:Mitochondrial acidic protein MAM33 n=1 Tax=Hymenoscyphus fraxineus TaxID=746836 RepID=A0A9N9PT11_9HELO|nr:hypothetical protein HYFRA_00009958 [Hymenoscyphus fraxineus]